MGWIETRYATPFILLVLLKLWIDTKSQVRLLQVLKIYLKLNEIKAMRHVYSVNRQVYQMKLSLKNL